jgi:hypothetical protein
MELKIAAVLDECLTTKPLWASLLLSLLVNSIAPFIIIQEYSLSISVA